MARNSRKLTDIKVKSTKATDKLQKLTDGSGLQLWITPQNGRYWRLDYRFSGKRKLLALGTYPDVTLAAARDKAQSARSLLVQNIDPSEDRKVQKRRSETDDEKTFSSIARRLVAKKKKEGRADATLSKMEWILAKVKSTLGSRLITEITTPDVMAALRKEEDADNLETARRMRTVVGEVFRYAIQTGVCTHDPVGATRGAIARPRPQHRSAILDPQQFGVLLQKIDQYAVQNVVVGSALKLMALLYPRPGELRQATWAEFDLVSGLWTIPAARTKMRQTHIVPLSKQANEILNELLPITGPNGFVFPGTGKSANCISENTMNIAMRRMGIGSDEHTAHGFRATASTLLNATGRFSVDAIERSLAHQDRDAVRRAYARGNSLDERKAMSQWWADELDRLRGDP